LSPEANGGSLSQKTNPSPGTDMPSDLNESAGLYSLIRKNSFYVFLERMIVPVVNFLITVYIIRLLPISDYGIYNILIAVMGYVSLLSSLGIPTIFLRFIPEFYEKKEIGRLRQLVEKGLLTRFLLSLGIILVIIVFSDELGNLFRFQAAFKYFAIFSIAIIFYLEAGLLSLVLISVFNHKSYVISQIVYVLFRAGLVYYLLKIGKGLVGFLIAESISFGLLLILQLFYYRKFLSAYPAREKIKLPLKRLQTFGAFSYLNELGGQILDVSTDFFIISAFLGPVAVGIYGFASRVMEYTLHVMPQFMFMNIIRPAFFTKYTQDNTAIQLNRMFNFLIKMIAFFTFPVVIGMFIMGDKLIIYVFDPKYIKSLNILWIVAAFTGLNFFIDPIGFVLQAKEKIQALFYSKIFAIYNLVGDLLVVKKFGIVGVAVVTGSAVLLKNIFCYMSAKKYANLVLEVKCLAIIAINSLIMGVSMYPLRGRINSLISLVMVVALGGLVYLLAAYLNRAFSPQERDVVNRILPRPIFVF
jgi:O-antigen/teichoic acid export membrane protein